MSSSNPSDADRVPLIKSVLARTLALAMISAVLVAGATQFIVWRASLDLANSAVHWQVRQVGEMLAQSSAAGIRFKDTDGLSAKLEEAISHSGGQITAGLILNADGTAIANFGAQVPDLENVAKAALTSSSETWLENHEYVGLPSLNGSSGSVVGAIALEANAEGFTTKAMEASLRAGLLGLLVLAIAMVPTFLILRSTLSRPLLALGYAMSSIANKRYDVSVEGIGRKDEVGLLSRDLETFRKIMEANAEASQSNLFKSAAFSQTNSAMMMVDRDLVIIDQNRASESLMAEYAHEFSVLSADFDANSVVGSSIDIFHAKPGHVREILDDPANMPYTADISVGDLKLELKISAIFDEEGDYAGNILEWRNVGADRLSTGIIDVIDQNQSLIEYSPAGKVLRANEHAQGCFGYVSDEFMNMTFADLFPSQSEEATLIKDALDDRKGFVGKVLRLGRDRRQIWVETSINLVVDGNGKPYRIVEIATDVDAAEKSRLDNEAERNRMVENQNLVVESLKSGLRALADGNLLYELSEPFADEHEQLRMDFNSATAKLRSTLTQMVQVASNVQDGTQEISQASDDLSRRTESQAATLANTAAAMDELTTSVKSSAEGAQEADKAVAGTKDTAQSGGAVVVQAVEAMKAIEKSSEQISQIIGVIDDIAFQTNLLALNAGVEAARAGDAGRGFAVVASEVRALAQRSSEAAREIKELISASSDQVGKGVHLVDQTGDALQDIVSSVESIAIQVSEIAVSSQQQAEGLEEINDGMNRLDSVTQQNAAMVEEATAASHAMRQEAVILSDLIDFFQTGSASEKSEEAIGSNTPQHGDALSSLQATGSSRNEPNSLKMKRAVGADIGSSDEPDQQGWEDF